MLSRAGGPSELLAKWGNWAVSRGHQPSQQRQTRQSLQASSQSGESTELLLWRPRLSVPPWCLGWNPRLRMRRDSFLEHTARVAALPRKLASAVLGTIDAEELSSENSVGDDIRRLRAELIRYPRNSLAWIDLALAYTRIAKAKRAKRCIESPLTLDSENRFVLRSAVRFFLHTGDLGLAHRISCAGAIYSLGSMADLSRPCSLFIASASFGLCERRP